MADSGDVLEKKPPVPVVPTPKMRPRRLASMKLDYKKMTPITSLQPQGVQKVPEQSVLATLLAGKQSLPKPLLGKQSPPKPLLKQQGKKKSPDSKTQTKTVGHVKQEGKKKTPVKKIPKVSVKLTDVKVKLKGQSRISVKNIKKSPSPKSGAVKQGQRTISLTGYAQKNAAKKSSKLVTASKLKQFGKKNKTIAGKNTHKTAHQKKQKIKAESKENKSVNVKKRKKSNDQSQKRKRKHESESSDDDNILYSLPGEHIDVKTNSNKLIKKTTQSARKKLKMDSTLCGDNSVNSMDFIDPEITFKSIAAPKTTRKLLLKDSMRPKTTVVKPVPRKPGSQTAMIKASIHSEMAKTGNGSVMYSPPACTASCSTARLAPHVAMPLPHSDNSSPMKSLDSYMYDLPTISVVPIIPSSPTTISYKNLIKNLPQKLQANRGFIKRKHSDSDADEELVERRLSVRQSESAFKYKEIVVKKCTGYTQIWLFSTSKAKNALNTKVLEELSQALHNAKFDDSRLVMLTGSDSIFCSGLDLDSLLTEDRRKVAKNMTDALRNFIGAMISFPKPIVAAVNGPAVGIGVAILPLCDIVYASDKASFYMPYARLAQTPEGCSSFTFPQVMGMAMANEMLIAGRKLTAIEAHQIGLVSQVFWPTILMQEVIPRVQNIATFSAKALEASKILIRSHQRAKLEYTNESECQMLLERWCSGECQKAIRAYLDDETDILL